MLHPFFGSTGSYTATHFACDYSELPTLYGTTHICMGATHFVWGYREHHTFVWELQTFVWELYTLLHGAKGATIFRMGLFVELSNSLTPSLMMKTTAMYNVESRTKLTHNCPPTELSLRLSLVRTQLRAHVAQDVTKI